MNARLLVPALLLVVACGPGAGSTDDVRAALDALPDAHVLALGPDGVPTFVHGDLGRVEGHLGGKADAALSPELAKITPVFRLSADTVLPRTLEEDGTGFLHARYAQRRDGLDVVGGDLTVHVNARGTIFAVHGTAEDADGELDANAVLTEQNARDAVVDRVGAARFEAGRLVYKIDAARRMHLAWELAADTADEGPARFWVDAHDGTLVGHEALRYDVLARKIYDAQNGDARPGTLVLEEGQPPSDDPQVQAAFDGLGTFWRCYAGLFGRDSYDGEGGVLQATVHYGQSYANAFWDPEAHAMVFGDGDGQEAGPLVDALDVLVHEVTHGVVSESADLRYENESGALNEGMADIMGAVCEAWDRGGVDGDTWKVGEAIWTPAVDGDALRYMDDPTKDEYSTDWWPERSDNWWDNGGVHSNSGIANLAFHLLAVGGTHPREKSEVRVPALGLERSAKVFYRALTQYMTTQTDFAGARAATVRAALDLYGADAAAQVDLAWDAVGVPKTEDGAPEQPAEACADGYDDDGNGYADCADPACADYGACVQALASGDLVFSEIAPWPLAGAGDPENEWVEVHNTTDSDLDLAGFTFGSNRDGVTGHRIAQSVVVPAGGFAVLAYAVSEDAGFTPAYAHHDWRVRLANDGDLVWLLDRTGAEVARLDWAADGFPSAEKGRSFVLDGPDPAGWDAPARWRLTDAPAYDAAGDRGTPGAANDGW